MADTSSAELHRQLMGAADLVDTADMAMLLRDRSGAAILVNRAIGLLVAVHAALTADRMPEPGVEDVQAA